jgi:F1F0 ATPase subunit 2
VNINIYSLYSLFFGLILGLLYFSGLWLTIKNMQKSRSPVALTLISFFLRTAAVLFALIFVARQGNYMNIVILLVGFIIGRFILSRRIGLPKKELKS